MKYDVHHTTIRESNGSAVQALPRVNSRANEVAHPVIPDAGKETLPKAPVSQKRGGSLKKGLMIMAALALAVTAGLWLRHWWLVGRFIEQTDDAFVGADTTVIASRVPGFVAELLVTDNQQVQAGDLLARIDDRDYKAQMAEAVAAVETQEAKLADLDASAHLQAAVVEQTNAKLKATAAEKWRADADVVRSQHLLKTRLVSEEVSQQADATASKAAAEDEAAHAALLAARLQLEVIAAQKKQATAALAQAKAHRDLAQLNVGFTEIRSPVNGVVGNRHAQRGAYATVGAQLFSIVPSEGLWVDANFKESQLAHMREGQKVNITADILPGETFSGKVESLAPATGAEFSLLPPENATGNFTKIVQRVPIRIRLEGEAAKLGKLRPGLSVIAQVDQR